MADKYFAFQWVGCFATLPSLQANSQAIRGDK